LPIDAAGVNDERSAAGDEGVIDTSVVGHDENGILTLERALVQLD
jgi:hypothetical protein